MKTLIQMLSSGFIAILLYSACTKSNTIIDESLSQSGVTRSNASNVREQQTDFCTNCAIDDVHGESASEFANVVARYRTTHQLLFNNFARGSLNASAYPNMGVQTANNFVDARSCWFALDTLKKFICLMERYSQQVGLSSSQLGIRFYYGVYWDGYQRDTRLSNCHTLYLAATQNSFGGINEDFDPRRSADLSTIVPLSGLISPGSSANLFMIGGRSGARPQVSGQPTMNQGDLCPPGIGCTPTLSAIDAAVPYKPLDGTSQ